MACGAALALACRLQTPPTETAARPEVVDDGPDGLSGVRTLATLAHWMQRPRGLGDPRRDASIAELVDDLRRRGMDRVDRIDHRADDPGGTGSYALTEIVAHIGAHASRRFVLATHFDTRPWADEEPDPSRRHLAVPGANDGTSGLALVLELIGPLRARLPADVGFSVVLLDGEELGHPGGEGYCAGSRHLAERIRAGEHPLLARAELGIVLDMIGDRDLDIEIDPASRDAHPRLVAHVWRTATDLGIAAFWPDVRDAPILDDHSFLIAAGIPSVLLIDDRYAAWHRTSDTVERVSAASLDAVGDVVLRSLLTWFSAP